MMPQQPNEFAALLIQKLEAVKRERESEEKLLRIVAEVRLQSIHFLISEFNFMKKKQKKNKKKTHPPIIGSIHSDWLILSQQAKLKDQFVLMLFLFGAERWRYEWSG